MDLVVVETFDKALRLRPVLGRRWRVMVFPPPVRELAPGGLRLRHPVSWTVVWSMPGEPAR